MSEHATGGMEQYDWKPIALAWLLTPIGIVLGNVVFGLLATAGLLTVVAVGLQEQS